MVLLSLRIATIALVVSSFVSIGAAQTVANDPEATNPEAQTAVNVSEETRSGTVDDIKVLKEQIDALAKKVKSEEEKSAMERAENAQMRAKLEELQTAQDTDFMDEETGFMEEEVHGFQPSLDIYGYMDFGLLFSELYKTNALFGPVPDKSSFLQNQINLYFSGNIEESLNALVELRFSFLPNGADSNYAIPLLGPESTYERIDTTVFSPTSSEELTFNGVAIERAVISWSLFDFLGIRAGRFITPVGIWNVDHSPTIVLPIRLPYIITMEPIPLRQTGVEIFGSAFPISNTRLEYSVTLSNGRGPTEQVYDLDDNKALGGRLKGVYESENFSAALGGYLYWGTVTDIKKSYLVDSSGVNLTSEPTEKYKELAGSGDLTIKYEGLILQGEYARTVVHYDVRPVITYLGTNMNNAFDLYWPDFANWNAYGLIAYEVALSLADMNMVFIPFVMYEYNSCDGNVYPQLIFTDIRGGLVYRPIAVVSLKYELSHYTIEPKQYVSVSGQGKSERNAWENQIQVAVSF